jgi:hypothetical protein
MNIHSGTQLLAEFSNLKEEKRPDINNIFWRIFKSAEFDGCENEMLIAYLAMRIKLLENRIEKLEGYIHG